MKSTKTFEICNRKTSSMRTMGLACLGMALCMVAVAQDSSQPAGLMDDAAPQTSAAPAAYVYVSNGDIAAFSAASNGKLTAVPGSPFAASVGYLAGNGKFLFGSTLSATDIESYAIESNGALRYAATENVVSADGGCGDADQIFTDHTGETLYDMAYYGNQCSNNAYEQFSINQSTGKVTYLGIAGNDNQINGRMSFTKNNEFAYSADCYRSEASIFGFKRASNGKLTQLSINPALPAAGENEWYCPWLAESDPFNHLAVSMGAINQNLDAVGPNRLAVYTVSSTGTLTTTSTSKNMATVSVGSQINAMNTSPAGNLLAVAGNGGLQVFHFNGANPITHYTGLLTSSRVDQIFWDSANHLYAIGASANRLWVFTVTPTGYSQAPGSPYVIHSPQGLRVMTIAQ